MYRGPGGHVSWTREEPPLWDADKLRILAGAPEGAFVLSFAEGDRLLGDWWSVRDAEGAAIGYGRLDPAGGDAEILIAVDPNRQQCGVGTFILRQLDMEAQVRGLEYLHHRIRDHDLRDIVHDWLVVRGFRGPVDGDLRKRVGVNYSPPIGRRRQQVLYDTARGGGPAGSRTPGTGRLRPREQG